MDWLILTRPVDSEPEQHFSFLKKRTHWHKSSYQKKNLDKKLASSTGDFCILSAAPVWVVCTWVAPERVLHICVPCAAPFARPQGRDVLTTSVLHFAPLELFLRRCSLVFVLGADCLCARLSARPPRSARSASASVWGASILYGLA